MSHSLGPLCSSNSNQTLRIGGPDYMCTENVTDCDRIYSIAEMRVVLEQAMKNFKVSTLIDLSLFFDQIPSSCAVGIELVPTLSPLQAWVELCLNKTLDMIWIASYVILDVHGVNGELINYPCLVSQKLSERGYFLAVGPASTHNHLDPLVLLKPFNWFVWACVLASWVLIHMKSLNRPLLPVANFASLILIVYQSNLKALLTSTDIHQPLLDGSVTDLIQKLKEKEITLPKYNFDNGGAVFFYLNNLEETDWYSLDAALNSQTPLFPASASEQEKKMILCESFMKKPGVVFVVPGAEVENEYWRGIECPAAEVARERIEIKLPNPPVFFIFPRFRTERGRALRAYAEAVSEMMVGLKDKIGRGLQAERERFRREMLVGGRRQDVMRPRHFTPAVLVLQSGLLLSTLAFLLEVFVCA